jgi:large subunit ribosomal protein L24
MKLKINDKVLIIAGKYRGKTGKITKVIQKHNKIVVEGINMVTKHIKKQQGRAGEKIVYEAPFSACNAMILDPGMNKPTRVLYKVLANGRKERISKISGASLDDIPMEAAAEPVKKVSTTAKAKSKKKTTIKA